MSESVWKKLFKIGGWQSFFVGLGIAVVSSQIAKVLENEGS
jgi:hypothetical protein